MAPVSLTLACLLVATNAAEPADTVFMNTSKFSIPITIKPEKRTEISALELHMSSDRGQSWNLFARATPDKDYFHITTPGDGPFWFTVVVVYSDVRREPTDVRAPPVGPRVCVDTAR